VYAEKRDWFDVKTGGVEQLTLGLTGRVRLRALSCKPKGIRIGKIPRMVVAAARDDRIQTSHIREKYHFDWRWRLEKRFNTGAWLVFDMISSRSPDLISTFPTWLEDFYFSTESLTVLYRHHHILHASFNYSILLEIRLMPSSYPFNRKLAHNGYKHLLSPREDSVLYFSAPGNFIAKGRFRNNTHNISNT
jgi:hypothetical protein